VVLEMIQKPTIKKIMVRILMNPSLLPIPRYNIEEKTTTIFATAVES